MLHIFLFFSLMFVTIIMVNKDFLNFQSSLA